MLRALIRDAIEMSRVANGEVTVRSRAQWVGSAEAAPQTAHLHDAFG